MAEQVIEVPDFPAFSSPAKIEATTTSQIDETFAFTKDAILCGLEFVKPADTEMAVDAVYSSPSATTVPLLRIASGDAVSSGVELSGYEVSRRSVGHIRVTTTGGTSGTKTVMVKARQAGGGA